MSPPGMMLLLLCLAVFHSVNCNLASYLKNHAAPIIRSQGLRFVDKMEMLGQRSNQYSVQATSETESPWFCHGLDCPVFKALKGGAGYEAREYDASNWFSTSLTGVDLSEATDKMFEKLFDYIEGENDKKVKIKMTAPVLIRLIPGPGPTCKSNFTMSFFDAPNVPNPPTPTDKTVFFSELPKQKVYVGSFGGFANEQKWLEAAEKLSAALIKDGKKFEQDYFLTAGYDSPFRILERHNEVWYIAED